MRFLFIDKILKLEKGSCIHVMKNVCSSEDYFRFHFPNFPVMPGALVIETLNQAATLLLLHSESFGGTVALQQVQNAKFRKVIAPGDQLQGIVSIRDRTEDTVRLKGVMKREGKMVASTDLIFSMEANDGPDQSKQIPEVEYLVKLLSGNIYRNIA
ncbi:MAG: beta-hydroxyacyl-ACP dehydratase [Proteobacteria bacterium]|nr:beta-hydroxyacyl-ACP dehydratase [Pseudomonadota bacterium]